MGEELKRTVSVSMKTPEKQFRTVQNFQIRKTKSVIFFSYLRVDVEKDTVGKLTVELAAHQASGKKCGEENRRTGDRSALCRGQQRISGVGRKTHNIVPSTKEYVAVTLRRHNNNDRAAQAKNLKYMKLARHVCPQRGCCTSTRIPSTAGRRDLIERGEFDFVHEAVNDPGLDEKPYRKWVMCRI